MIAKKQIVWYNKIEEEDKMKEIFAVIGSLFGDEGKGLVTDYLCEKPVPTLNVRYNGTGQASHTVVRDGKRKIFHSIGAGSFLDHVDTFLGEHYVVNPYVLYTEVQYLMERYHITPIIYIHNNCRIATHYDIEANRQRESARGKDRHGSCGLGFFETIHRYNRGIGCFPIETYQIQGSLHEIRAYYESCGFSMDEIQDTDEEYLQLMTWLKQYCHIVDNSILNQYERIVFEGAQGLSLGMRKDKYFPHLTPSEPGMPYIQEMLREIKEPYNFSVFYPMRSYGTRHGNGPFPTECNRKDLGKQVRELTNITNDYQGSFRFGWFPAEEIQENIREDLQECIRKPDHVSIVITHLDQTDGKLLCKNGKHDPTTFLPEYDHLYSFGETAKDIREEIG